MDGDQEKRTDGGTNTTVKNEWQRPTQFYNHTVKYAIYGIIALFLLWSVWEMRVSPERFIHGFSTAQNFFSDAWPPNTDPRFLGMIYSGMAETIGMSIVATIFGILLSIPVAFMGAKNFAPKPVYYVAKIIIATSRSLHALILAIIFVIVFGIGAFAGVLTLAIRSIGFFAKFWSEDIEDIDITQYNAVKATGANYWQVMLYGIIPQVVPRFVGLTVYRWDINLRSATIVGLVGAGGIGHTLITSLDRYQYDVAFTILLVILMIVMIGEIVSLEIRKRVQ